MAPLTLDFSFVDPYDMAEERTKFVVSRLGGETKSPLPSPVVAPTT